MTQTENNPLYPIFLKLHQLNMVIVGAGEVGHEKLFFMLKSSPEARITFVAPWVNPEIHELLEKYPGHHVKFRNKKFEASDLEGFDLVVAATADNELNRSVRKAAKAKGQLVNVADTPDLCDFYLGSIVTRGNLKVAISTNGKSPTFAKRFRQILEETLPENATDLLDHLYAFREKLRGDFTEKVNRLNELTASLIGEGESLREERN